MKLVAFIFYAQTHGYKLWILLTNFYCIRPVTHPNIQESSLMITSDVMYPSTLEDKNVRKIITY